MKLLAKDLGLATPTTSPSRLIWPGGWQPPRNLLHTRMTSSWLGFEHLPPPPPCNAPVERTVRHAVYDGQRGQNTMAAPGLANKCKRWKCSRLFSSKRSMDPPRHLRGGPAKAIPRPVRAAHRTLDTLRAPSAGKIGSAQGS